MTKKRKPQIKVNEDGKCKSIHCKVKVFGSIPQLVFSSSIFCIMSKYHDICNVRIFIRVNVCFSKLGYIIVLPYSKQPKTTTFSFVVFLGT